MKQAISWVLIFTGVVILAILVLYGLKLEQLSFLSFPAWLWIFLGVEMLFSFLLYLFIRNYWKER